MAHKHSAIDYKQHMIQCIQCIEIINTVQYSTRIMFLHVHTPDYYVHVKCCENWTNYKLTEHYCKND